MTFVLNENAVETNVLKPMKANGTHTVADGS